MKTEDLKFILERIDSNIGNTNNKATLLIALETFIIGKILSETTIVNVVLNHGLTTKILFYLSLFSLVLSGIYAILSIKPLLDAIKQKWLFFSKKEKSHRKKSNIFFGEIANMNESQYIASTKRSNYNFENDLKNQIVEVAKIATYKFEMLGYAIDFLVYGFVCSWICIVIIFIWGGIFNA